MTNNKVLVITPQYFPDYGPSAPIYTALCEDLSKMGCDVTVVTGFPNYIGSNTNHMKSNKLFDEEIRNGVRIIRTYVFTVSKSALWGRLLYHLSFNIFSTLASFRVHKVEIVLADAPTLWSGLSLVVTSLLKKIPFIYIIHDIYPDVLLKLGVLRNRRILGWIGGIENYFYIKSSGISVLSQGFKENLIRKNVPKEKITIIPACVDVDFIRPTSKNNKLQEKWGLKNKFVVLYAGNIGLSQGLDTLLGTASILLDYPDILFVLVGEGATKPELENMAEEKRLKNVKFFPFQPREDVPLIYSLADVCIVSLKRDIVVESVPSKTYTIMASGRPIVATVNHDTEVRRLIEQTQCGISVDPEDPQKLSEAILKLHQNPSLGEEMGKRGRDYIVKNLSNRVAAKQYCDLIHQITCKDS
jgi:colanic acid biosynthesis glycosyl transferase WcaI